MSELNTGMIQVTENGHSTPGYLAQPAAPGAYPGIVVIQEWWGLVGHIKDVAERFAAEGFAALAPDLYHGETAEEPNEAKKLRMALDRVRAIKEVSAAARHLQGMETVVLKKIGVVGFCMGGGLSLSAAAHDSIFGAAVCFYGRPLEAADTAKIGCPVLGLFGEEDHGIPLSLVYDFERELEANDIPHHIHVYAGAQHAFFNETRPSAYHPEASEDAWKRTLAWFRQHLT